MEALAAVGAGFAVAHPSLGLTRHAKEFLAQLAARRKVLQAQFEAIDTLDYQPSYDQALLRVQNLLHSLFF